MAETKRVVGIDLGTTNSLVAFMQGEKPVVIPGEDGLEPGASVVAIGPARDGSRPCHAGRQCERGNALLTHAGASHLLGQAPHGPRRGRRRRGIEVLSLPPGRRIQPGEVLRIRLGEREYTPPEISAHILRQLKRNAERYFGAPVTQAVITVPAYFNDAQRQATKDAGRMAGLEVLRLVNEPTAAALAYGLDRQKEGIIAVYDFGGGTFDISILKLHEGIFEVIATNGDTHLGGDDIDNLCIAIALDDIAGDAGDRSAPAAGGHPGHTQGGDRGEDRAFVAAAVRTSISSFPGGASYRAGTDARTIRTADPTDRRSHHRALPRCDCAMRGLTPDQIDEVVLVGGSTRIPLVQRLVSDVFELPRRGKQPRTELNPDEVVALGAAVQANILGGGSKATEDMLLLDVTPLSLGIEALGGVVAKIIQRNSTIPASASESFTTGVDGQTNVAIHVLQGEREMAKDCRSLARFDLKGIPPMSAGLPRIEVKFLIDANGILHVSAVGAAQRQAGGGLGEAGLWPDGRAGGVDDSRVLRSCRRGYSSAPVGRSQERSGHNPECVGKSSFQSGMAAARPPMSGLRSAR